MSSIINPNHHIQLSDSVSAQTIGFHSVRHYHKHIMGRADNRVILKLWEVRFLPSNNHWSLIVPSLPPYHVFYSQVHWMTERNFESNNGEGLRIRYNIHVTKFRDLLGIWVWPQSSSQFLTEDNDGEMALAFLSVGHGRAMKEKDSHLLLLLLLNGWFWVPIVRIFLLPIAFL